MNQINKNRLIGGSVIAFAALLFAPAILTPKEHDLSNPTLSVSIDKGSLENTQVATTQPAAAKDREIKNIPVPPAPTLKLESAPATPVAKVGQVTKKEVAKATPTALEKKTVETAKPAVKPAATKSSWLRVGSYASAKNATNQLKILNKSKYSVKVEQIMINGKTYHRVLVGPYNDEKTLQAAKKALVANGYEANIQR